MVENKKTANLPKDDTEKRVVRKPGIPKVATKTVPKTDTKAAPKSSLRPINTSKRDSKASAEPNKTPMIDKQKSLGLHGKRPSSRIGSGPGAGAVKKTTSGVPKTIKDTKVVKAESKYEEMKDRVNPEDLEVFSDYSYDPENDNDKPENTMSFTCKIEIVRKPNGQREMLVRKQYYLEDGRELRVKNINPVKVRPSLPIVETNEDSQIEGITL